MSDILGCSTCVEIVHKRCDEIKAVDDKSNDVLNNEEYGDFSRNMAVIEQNAHDMIRKAKENVTKSERISTQTIDLIKQYRLEVRVAFDELEQNLIRHVETITSEDKKKMQDIENELTELSKTIEKMRSEENNLIKSRPVCQVDVQTKFWTDEKSVIDAKLCKAQQSNAIRLFSFDPNNNIKRLANESGLGKIVILNGQIEETCSPVPEDNQTIRDATKTNMPDNCTGDSSVDEIIALLSQIEEKNTPLVASNTLNQLENVEQETSDKIKAKRSECRDDESSGSFNLEFEKLLDLEQPLYSDRREDIAESSEINFENEIAVSETCQEHQEKKHDCDVCPEQSDSVNQEDSSLTEVVEDATDPDDKQEDTCPKTEIQFENLDIPSKDDNHHHVLAIDEENAKTDDSNKDQWDSLKTMDYKKNDRDVLVQFDSAVTCTPESKPETSDIDVDNATQHVYVQTKDILSKLTPQSFQTVVSQIQALPVDSEAKLCIVMDQIFKKHASKESVVNEDEHGIHIENQRLIGIIRFMGELYELNVLPDNIMHTCVNVLLYERNNGNPDRVCLLLTIIGKIIDVDIKSNGLPRQPCYQEKNQEDPDDLYKKTRSILNKLSPQNFRTLVSQMQALPITSEAKLKGVIDIVFEIAITGPKCVVAHANMCRCLAMLKVPSANNPKEQVNFRAVLLTRCQREFEKDKSSNIIFKDKREQIKATELGARRDELKAELDYEESKARRISLGNIRFVGELFKLRMLTENIMHDCVFKLIRTKDPENLECMCQLFTTIGKELDVDKAKPRMDQYFQQMKKIINEKIIPSRVQLLLQEVVDLRMNRWVPHQEDNSLNLTTFGPVRHTGLLPQHSHRVKKEGTFGGGAGAITVSKTFGIRENSQGVSFRKPLSGGAYVGGAFGWGKTLPNLRNRLENMSSNTIWVTLKTLIVIENVENGAVFNWINANVDEPLRSKHQFTSLLMKAICYGAIKCKGHKDDESAISENIIRRKNLLTTYITDKQDSELHALYALQALVTQLKHPPGVLLPMFDTLHDNGVISEKVFLQWKHSEVEPDGKQACLNEVDQFFLLINFKRLIDADTKK